MSLWEQSELYKPFPKPTESPIFRLNNVANSFFESDRAALEDVEPVLKEGGPLSRRELGLDRDEAQKIISRMM